MTILYVDSRNRVNVNQEPSSCHFQLQQGVQLSNAKLVHFQFGNTLFNITSQNNTLFIDGMLAATITPKFWFAQDFVDELNLQLKTFFSSESDIVTFDSETNKLNWNLSGTILYSPMNNVLGITSATTGTFQSSLFLATCMTLGLNIQQLEQQTFNTTFAYAANISRPSFVVPVTSGYLEMQSTKLKQYMTFNPPNFFNVLDVYITDAATNQRVNVGEWCATFVVE